MRPLEEILPREERDRIRRQGLEEPGFYSPWLHIAATTVSGVSLMALGLWLIDEVHAAQVAFGVFIFLLSNATEWRIHRDVLHRRFPVFGMLYDKHTPLHHRCFITDDMSIRSWDEFRLVLIPAYGVVGVALLVAGPITVVWLVLGKSFAGVFLFTTMLYVTSYEWLHLSYHLPPESFIGRMRIVRFLRTTHAIHHDPRLMQRWNFNVTLPLWDLVRGTWVRDREAALAARK